MTCLPMMQLRRASLAAITVGLGLAAVLLLSREFFGGRAVTFWLENTGGVWLVSAFVTGWLAGKAFPGAVAGFVALLIVLFCSESVSLAAGDGFSARFSPHFRSVWLAAGALAGAGLGFLGGWSAEEDEWRWLGSSVLGALLVGEAVGLFVDGVPHPAYDSGMAAAQIFVGTGVVLAGVRGRVRFRSMAVFLGLSIVLVVTELVADMITSSVWG